MLWSKIPKKDQKTLKEQIKRGGVSIFAKIRRIKNWKPHPLSHMQKIISHLCKDCSKKEV